MYAFQQGHVFDFNLSLWCCNLFVFYSDLNPCSRQPGEESDGDCSRDSSSEGSSDYEHEGVLKAKKWSRNSLSNTSMLRMDRLSLRGNHMLLQDGFSSDDGGVGYAQGCLLFEYLEQDPPYCREPLADKASSFISLTLYHILVLSLFLTCILGPFRFQILRVASQN